MIVTLPTEGKLVIELMGSFANDEQWGCNPPHGSVEVAQQPGRLDLRLLEPPSLGKHGGLCRASVRLFGRVTVGPLARGEWLLDPEGATFWHVRFEGSDGRSIELR